jgi:hypothetical protein
VTPGKFLRLIWPDEGFYCIAHPFKPEGSSVTVYAHKVFASISEAVTHVYEMQARADTYFAVLSLREERVWSAEKKDYKTGEKGAWAVRTQANMLASKCSFFDLDVGAEATKYPTQRDALAGLIEFLKITGLPMPTLVSSGGGVHVYWHYDAAIPVAEWRTLAWHMRKLAEHHKLKVDPTRTIDSTSVLRVPDTYNWKDRANPRPVKALQEGVVTPAAEFKRLVSDAIIRAGIEPGDAPAPGTGAAPPIAGAEGLAAQSFNDFGPPPTLEELGAVCGQVREIVASQVNPKHAHYGQLDNTAWYRGMIATLRHAENGEDWCRRLTALHPRTNADIEAKLQQAQQFPPARCETLQEYMPWKDAPCQGCRFRSQVANPFMAARKGTPAPPPMASSEPSSPPAAPTSTSAPSPTSAPLAALLSPAMTSVLIPNPPKPFERLKAGGIAITTKDKDDNETTRVIYANDLYPLKRLVNSEEGVEQQIWRVTLPRTGVKDFLLDADALYDSRKFATAMANNGIYPNKADLPALQDYMVAYISQLQKDLDADSQTNHLGWADEYRQFILPDKTLHADGSVRVSALTQGAARAAQHVGKKGELAKQIELLRFYDRPEYIPNQSVILDAIASIIFYATGNHGIVVNCSGDSGASKSTTLYTASSIWGDPKMWPINGTNRGATANARTQRIVTNANLPTCVDEITHLPPREAIDLVMNITQPGHRLRLQTDGSERKMSDNYKSAIMIATANSSLHSLLSTDNAAGTAGSMRVFEMKFVAQRVHTKAEADEYLRQLEQHWGHIGEIVAQFVVKHRAAVEHRVHAVLREIDTEAKIAASERFWSARTAAGFVAGEIAQALGLLSYDPLAIRKWAIERQIPYMRGIVREEYRDPLAVLTDYIAEKHGNIVIVDQTTTIGTNTGGQHVAASSSFAVNRPMGALLGHYDIKTGLLLLLKQGFKEHCARIGASASRILEELSVPRALGTGTARKIIIERNARRTLGAGTDFAKGQTYCFIVDMKHPEIAGASPVLVASNDEPAQKAAQA